ncbi:MAG: cupredoxin domain-containing protein [Solirubrobacteraceae bacterium]
MRLSSSRLALPAALVAAGAALLAPAAAEAGRVQKVDIGSNFFAPGKKTVRKGDKVRFVWEEFGFEAHDVNVRTGPAKFSSPLQAGGTWTTKKLRKPGRYSLYCSQHQEMRMTLTVKRR